MFLHNTILRNEMGEQPDAGGDGGDADFTNSLMQAGQEAQGIAPAVKEAPVEQPKPEVKAEAKAPEKASVADKLGKVEDEIEEQAPETEDEPPTYKGRVPTEKERTTWASLKRESQEYKDFKTKYAELETKLAEVSKSPISQEVQAELETLRQFHDVHNLRGSKEYQQAVTEPSAFIETEVNEIATTFGLNEDKLWKAFQEKSEWKRNDAIDQIAKDSEQEVRPGAIITLQKHADRMHGIWRKGAELESKASELRAAQDFKSKEGAQQMTQAQEQEWNKASEAALSNIEGSLAPILKNLPQADKDAFITSLKNAKISEDKTVQAYQARGMEVAGFLIQQVNSMRKQNSDLKKENAALVTARPGMGVKQPEKPQNRSVEEDDEEFMKGLLAG